MGLGDPPTNRAVRPRDIASDFEVLDSLLSTLTDVLDIRQVFDRVSEVVQPILPHDIMGVVEVNEAGNRFKLLAGAGSPTGSTPTERIMIRSMIAQSAKLQFAQEMNDDNQDAALPNACRPSDPSYSRGREVTQSRLTSR